MTPMLDVRLPIGALSAVIGALLLGYGVAHTQAADALALDTWWGSAMLLFGLAMLAASWRHARRQSTLTHPRRHDEEPEEHR
jgi:hypothetical protein